MLRLLSHNNKMTSPTLASRVTNTSPVCDLVSLHSYMNSPRVAFHYIMWTQQGSNRRHAMPQCVATGAWDRRHLPFSAVMRLQKLQIYVSDWLYVTSHANSRWALPARLLHKEHKGKYYMAVLHTHSCTLLWSTAHMVFSPETYTLPLSPLSLSLSYVCSCFPLVSPLTDLSGRRGQVGDIRPVMLSLSHW